MLKFVVVALASVSLAVAASLGADNPGSSSYDTAINEYLKEYLKMTHDQTREAPGKVEPERIKIRLYSSPEDVFVTTLKDWEKLLDYPQYNASLESKFFVHGWLEADNAIPSPVIATLYALRGKRVNYFTVDWSEYSHAPDFHYVAKEIVPKIAEYLYPMVQKVMEKQRNNRVHMIGFDMGAHMAGIVGKHVQGPKMARITGLSPAGRQYNEMSNDKKLMKGDAEYVDVIHTNMGGAGISKTLGDVDFLPAGGRQQPAAESEGDHTKKDIVSHMLARYYYIESIELGYAGYIGKQCDSYTSFVNQKCAYKASEIMGEPVSRRVNGTVYMTVNEKPKPYFSKGMFGIYPYPVSSTQSYTATTYPTPAH